ncbi:MAG: HEAT repeat domain-containing protein [Planctomycetes bacterium]|nr:HEAT repeat domain-containing protein [Planctomycetota bacterium]
MAGKDDSDAGRIPHRRFFFSTLSWLRASVPVLTSALLVLLAARGGIVGDEGEQPPIVLSDEEVQELIRQLGSDSYEVRERASQELGRMGSAAVPLLLQARDQRDPEVRSRAEAALRVLAGRLAAELESGSPESAYGTLLRLGDLALPRLTDFETFTEPRAQYLMVRLLARLDALQALPSLVQAARHASDPARQAAVLELARRSAVPELLDLVEEAGSADIQELAAQALIDGAGEELVPRLWEKLENFETRSRGLLLRLIAALDPQTPVSRLMPFLDEREEELSVQVAAVEALGEIRGPAVADLLFEKLERLDPQTCGAAARALARRGEPRLLPFLRARLQAENPRERRSALTAIAAARLTQAASEVEERLRDPDAGVRRAALVALGEMAASSPVPRILDALVDPDPDTRVEAVMALRRIASPSPICQIALVPGAHKLIRDPEIVPHVAEVVQAFHRGGTEEAFVDAALAVLYRHNLLQHPSPDVRHRAALALHRLGEKAAQSGVLDALDDPDVFVRVAAAEHLGPIGREDAIPALLRALDDEALLVQRAAAQSLGSLGALQAGPRLLEILLDDTAWPEVRKVAAASLALMDYAEAFPHFRQLVEDADPDVHLGAAAALATLGDSACVPPFLRLVRDGQAHHRQAALSCLQNFTGLKLDLPATSRRAQREAAIRRWEELWKSKTSDENAVNPSETATDRQ